MPRLQTSSKKPKALPPCGRRITYLPPHSPFQKLVDSKRVQFGFSYQQLAEQIEIDRGTFWIWLHSKNGFPHPKSCKPEHLKGLSKILKIPLQTLKDAYDSSRALYSKRENPMPSPTIDAFREFIEVLEHDSRQMVKRTTILNLAKRFYAGAAVEDSL